MANFKKLKPMPRSHRTASVQRLSAFPVPLLDPELASALRQVLETHNITDGQQVEDNDQIAMHDLFARGEPVSKRLAEHLFPAGLLNSLVRSGLLQKMNDQVQSFFQVQNYKGMVFLSDFFRESHKNGYVLQIGPAGKYLADLTIRKPFASALDLGCGCGIQSLLAAKHCALVTATDINPRALQLTRLNATFNEITNIETVEGSYFEPVRAQSFDLIVANLPYVITPENKYLYRDSGSARDTNLFSLIREIPSYLNERGFAHILANWIHSPDQPYWQPFKTALHGLPVDTWLFHNGSKNPAEYAEMWLDIPRIESTAYEEKKEDWMAWYQAQHIELIALGAITFRRRTTAQNWACSATVKKSLTSPAGGQIFDLFQAQDDLNSIENTIGLENARLVSLLSNASVTQLPSGRMLCLSAGAEISTEVGADTLEVLNFLDGRRTLGQAIRLANNPPEKTLDDIRVLIEVGIVRFTP